MGFETLVRHSRITIANPESKRVNIPQPLVKHSMRFRRSSPFSALSRVSFGLTRTNRSRFKTGCVSPSQEVRREEFEVVYTDEQKLPPILSFEEKQEEERGGAGGRNVAMGTTELGRGEDFGVTESIWEQMVEIAKFSGPATGLWLCGPLMSLIDTAVIGQSSSIELAALGPGTVLCDYMSYVFMFLSIATSNLVATAMAGQDKTEVQRQLSALLFIGLSGGVLMLFFTMFLGSWALSAFTGASNVHMLPAANTYVQIRGLAWPAVLVGWVAQSASLGMKDSWGPLKALAVASAINGIGDVVLCLFLGYGIAGAAWATMVSQVVAAFMMIEALKEKGYNSYALSIPSRRELQQIFTLAAPVFIIMISKVAFYSLLVYFATSFGTHTVAAHQVLVQIFCMCAVWGQPLSQTAQSFMPELIYGVNRSLPRARMLLKSLVLIGAFCGLTLGAVGTSVPWVFPKVFSPDSKIIAEMHRVLLPYFIALCVTSSTHSLEGTLLAGRDLSFISLSMSGIFCLATLLLWLLSSRGYGLPGCWWTLALFQWARFSIALLRVLSPDGVLYSEDVTRFQLSELKTT